MITLALAPSCGGDDDNPSPTPALVWAACGPLVADGAAGECATMPVPLAWATEDGPTIDVFVKRFTGSGPRGQLWILDGGPGGTGAQFDNADLIALFDQAGWDVYLPAHRGTGRSTPLECAAAIATTSTDGVLVTIEEAAACAAEVEATWGDGLAHFSAAQAARDLGALIEAARPTTGAQRVAIWGGSYGTYWAQRYLQAFPDQADAIVLEGSLDLTNRISDQLRAGNAAGERFLDACADDGFCAAHLGDDPRAAYDAAVATIAARSCPPLADVTVPTWKAMARTLVDVQLGYDARAILAAVVRRTVRCGPADAAVLAQFAAGLPVLAAQLDRADGDLTINNFMLALDEVRIDLWPADLDRAVVGPPHDGLRFASATEWNQLADLIERWPAQPRAVDADQAAVTTVPILVLSGGLDTATPLEWSELAASRYPGAQHVVFPYGGHGVTFDEASLECGLGLFLGFLADPAAAVDASCVDDVAPIDFATGGGARDLYREWLGTENLWGD